MIQQTKLAYDFIQKLYLEVSYLIKEIEGLLAEEEENFIIGRSGGYAITARSSNGLEANNVYLWPLRMLSVFFVPSSLTKQSRGQTITKFEDGIKVLHLRITLDEKDIEQPYLRIGVIHDIYVKSDRKYPNKFEQLNTHIEYNHSKVFAAGNEIDYEDAYVKFKAKYLQINLYDINSSDDIVVSVLSPVLELFRSIK